MVFPDYYFFAERCLVNHTIEKKRVNNLDDCELMCYLNDDWNDFFIYLEFSMPFYGKIRAVHMYVKCLI